MAAEQGGQESGADGARGAIVTTDASSPRIHLLRTIASDLNRRIDNANRVLRAAMTVDGASREQRIGLALTDISVAMLSLEALQIELAREPQRKDSDRTPIVGQAVR